MNANKTNFMGHLLSLAQAQNFKLNLDVDVLSLYEGPWVHQDLEFIILTLQVVFLLVHRRRRTCFLVISQTLVPTYANCVLSLILLLSLSMGQGYNSKRIISENVLIFPILKKTNLEQI